MLYSITGEVIEGNKIARDLGYPTLNLKMPDNFSLQFGIYAGIMINNDIKYKGIISVGITPNHLQQFPKLEIHLFDFNQNIYGEIITINFIEFIRPEIKFANLIKLKQQIAQDCIKAKEILQIIN